MGLCERFTQRTSCIYSAYFLHLLSTLLAVAAYEAPDAGGEGSTYEGTYDEYPELLEGLTTFEDGGSDGACGVDAGARVVDAYEVDEHEAQADGEASELTGALLLIGRTEDNEDEDHGEDDLSYEAAENRAAAGIGTGRGTLGEIGVGGYESVEEGAADEGADNLEDHVHGGVLTADALGEEAAEGDGGVDVATADATDGVGHSYYGKAEGEGGAHYAGGVTTTGEADGRAATHENEDGRADHFC